MIKKNIHQIYVLIFLGIILTAGICSVMISSSSLWIDEGSTAYLASQHSLADSFSWVKQTGNSELQMPGYVAYLWLWEKLFGHSEVSLRFAAAPFLFWVIVSLGMLKRSVRTKVILLLLVILHPFIWYNLNEARSTMIMFFLALLSLQALVNIVESNGATNKRDVWTLVIACCLGLLMNMLFFFFCITLIFLIARTITVKKFVQQQKAPVLVLLGIGILLGGYYAWTLSTGAGGMKEQIGFQNIVGIPYEFLGFIGLGPSRNMLRSNAVSLSTLKEYPGLAMLALVLCAFVILLMITRPVKEKLSIQRIPFWEGLVFGFILFISASTIVHFRFWARHVSFFLPLLLFGISEMLDTVTTTGNKNRLLAVAFVGVLILWLVSGTNIRWNAEYQKDNYRAAVDYFISGTPQSSSDWWAGSPIVAEYYGLQLDDGLLPVFGISKAKANLVMNPKSKEDLAKYPRESGHQIVLFKKFDLFDRYGVIRKFIQDHKYKMVFQEADFEVYRL